MYGKISTNIALLHKNANVTAWA